jgi:hypothetical protein
MTLAAWLLPYWPAISRLAEAGEVIEVHGPDRRVHKGRR